jgi:uncharacterized protein
LDRLKEYSIPFSGLSIGNHHFTLEIDDSFFDNFEYSGLHSANVHVEVNMERKERMLIFTFDFSGTVRTICDRCTEEFDRQIEDSETLVVKFGHEFHEESDDIIVIPDTEHQLNVAPFIHEYLQLMQPIRNVHPDDENGNSTCDPEMLRRIEELSHHIAVDPRWEALRKIQDRKGK